MTTTNNPAAVSAQAAPPTHRCSQSPNRQPGAPPSGRRSPAGKTAHAGNKNAASHRRHVRPQQRKGNQGQRKAGREQDAEAQLAPPPTPRSGLAPAPRLTTPPAARSQGHQAQQPQQQGRGRLAEGEPVQHIVPRQRRARKTLTPEQLERDWDGWPTSNQYSASRPTGSNQR